MVEPKQGDTTSKPAHEAPATEGRRGALKVLIAAGGLAYAGVVAVPAASFATASSAGDGGKERWVRVTRLADLREGEPRRLSIIGDTRDAFTITRDDVLGSVWLTRRGEALTAFSATCPHLGCSIDLAGDASAFGCPCHTSRFALDGRAESGPSPRGMDPLAARVVDGFVEIDFRRFRIGVTDRTEVGS